MSNLRSRQLIDKAAALADEKKNILFACLMHSGFGDLGHLIDIASPDTLNKLPIPIKRNTPRHYNPIYLIAANKQSKQRIVESLISAKIADEINHPDKYKNSQFEEYLAEFYSQNPHIFIVANISPGSIGHGFSPTKQFSNDINQLIEKRTSFNNALKNVVCYFDISAPLPFYVCYEEKGKYIPVYQTLFQAEHYSGFGTPNTIFNSSLGLGNSYRGFLLKPAAALSKNDRMGLLKKFGNKQYVQDLLELDSKGIEHSETFHNSATHFLDKTIFIPAYNAKLDTILAMVGHSKLFENREALIVHTNDDPSCNIRHFVQNNVFLSVKIINNGKTTEFKCENALSNKKLIILCNYQLKDEDYDTLFKVAEFFAGCSGDKTLEKCLSYGLVPFYNTPSYKKCLATFLENFSKQYSKKDLLITFSGRDSDAIDTRLTPDVLAKSIDDDFINDWKKLIAAIQKENNFFDLLPSMLAHGIIFNELKNSVCNNDQKSSADYLKLFNAHEDLDIAIALWHVGINHNNENFVLFVYDLISNNKFSPNQHSSINTVFLAENLPQLKTQTHKNIIKCLLTALGKTQLLEDIFSNFVYQLISRIYKEGIENTYFLFHYISEIVTKRDIEKFSELLDKLLYNCQHKKHQLNISINLVYGNLPLRYNEILKPVNAFLELKDNANLRSTSKFFYSRSCLFLKTETKDTATSKTFNRQAILKKAKKHSFGVKGSWFHSLFTACKNVNFHIEDRETAKTILKTYPLL